MGLRVGNHVEHRVGTCRVERAAQCGGIIAVAVANRDRVGEGWARFPAVKDGDGVAGVDETFGDGSADKAGAADEENSHV